VGRVTTASTARGRRRREFGPAHAVIDAPTTYSTARVESDPSAASGRLLFLGGIECSYVDLDDPTRLEFGYVRRLADAIDLVAPADAPLRVTHLGGGGFTLPSYLAATRPGSRQIVYEYDDALVELARAELGLRTSARLRVKVGDARERLARRSACSADVVVGDAFEGRTVPRHLATAEFLALVRRTLGPDGLYVLNVIDDPPHTFARAEAATLLEAFGHVALTADADVLRGKASGNLVFAASDRPLPVDGLARRASRGILPDRVLDRARTARFAGTAAPLRDRD
jgi:spermidine synthase